MARTTPHLPTLLLLLLATYTTSVVAQADVDFVAKEGGEARILYFNSSSTATSLTLLGSLILLGIIFYLVYIGGLLAPVSSSANNKNSYEYNPNDYYYQQDPYQQYRTTRSADDGYSAMNVLKWITMLQEVYEKFDYNDLECQKRLICDIMQEEKYFGPVSTKMRSGFEMAKYLEVLNLPDDFREILDEYIDASDRASGQKECEEFFQCPYSLKEVVKRNFSFNSV